MGNNKKVAKRLRGRRKGQERRCELVELARGKEQLAIGKGQEANRK